MAVIFGRIQTFAIFWFVTVLCHTNADDKYLKAIRFKRNADDFTSDEEETCPLADSCIVANVTSHSITVRWPCCSGTNFHLISNPVGFSRNKDSCECIKPRENRHQYYRNYNEPPENRETEKKLSTSDCFATFTNFCPYGDYKITIKSDDKTCDILQTTLPAVPTWNEKRAISENDIYLSWKDSFCTDHNKPIYRISWSGPDGVEITDEKVDTIFTLTFLSPNTNYKISLRACDNRNYKNDNKFCSENATAEISTKPGLPSEPVNLTAMAINSTTIILNWDPPIDPRGPIDGYNVTCRKGRRVVQNVSIFGNKSTSYFVTMLQLWTHYKCSVQAFNIDRDGTPKFIYGRESKADCITKPGKPSEPVHLNIDEITSDELLLSWQRPLTPRGPLDGYFVRVYNDKEDKIKVVSPLQQGHRFKTLSPGTSYKLSVLAFHYDSDEFRQASHAFINGTPANVTGRTKPAAPSSPRDVKVVWVTSREIFLRWKRPSSPGGSIDGYVIRVETDEEEIMLSGSYLKYPIQNLSPNTNYTVSIFAFNRDGEKRLDGEQVVVNNRTRDAELSPMEVFDQFRQEMSLQLSQMNRLLNETLFTSTRKEVNNE